ncbi:hypothetical protein [Rhodopila sp.]|uniref:hypothetical protein n=1 Tax=Rhodopila sp. TaxID=2480087 RepID=UPI002C540BC0|nr:hypothetical protein [Rhodopila sp.]HVZ07016.1 hypothetical protein [Rhodopila sp.]
MHTLSTSFVLGYHGCDRNVADRVLSGEPFVPSQNTYDWLGHGIYFWESNPRRGLEFAEELMEAPRGTPRISFPTVVGAIIDLGVCLDLTTSAGLSQLAIGYDVLRQIADKSPSRKIPTNKGLRRNLDCAVLNTVRQILEREHIRIDTVKAAFIEGEPVYPTANFYRKTHIQICVCEPDQIKGVFRVPVTSLR